jgi:hypothetical protein
MTSFRRFIYRALAVLGAIAVLAWSNRASAQTTVTLSGVVTRKVPNHQLADFVFAISRSDCLADDVLSFPLGINPPGAQIEAWVGPTDCSAQAARTSPNFQCLRVFSGTTTQSLETINLRAQDLALVDAQVYGLNGQNAGTAAACNKTSGSYAANPVTIHFLPITSNIVVSGTGFAWTKTSIDLLGPPPPTNFTVQPGSTFVKAQWDTTNDTDRNGFRFFCDPNPGDPTPDAGPVIVAMDATGGASGAGGADAGADADDSGSDAAVGAAGSSGAADSAGPSTPQCGGPSFTPGVVPSNEVLTRFVCGAASGAMSTSKVIEVLSNTPVAVAVASVDRVDNVGPLSPVVCTTPMPVNSFNDLYHNAGGTAGGGFCSLRRGSKHGNQAGWIGISLVLLAFCVQRRRTRLESN